MGLKIEYRPVYEHGGVRSIVFFKEQPLEIGEDRIEKGRDGKETRIKAPKGNRVIISANTIVINTNQIRWEFAAFGVYHECYHFQEHYLFFRLQEMGSNDFRQSAGFIIRLRPDLGMRSAISVDWLLPHTAGAQIW